jgi:RHS repeat-associated protein
MLASDDKNSVLSELSPQGKKGVAYTAYGHRGNDALAGGALGFNGERRETQTGWYLLGNGYRAYSPVLMRFNSPDSWSPFGEGGLNAYAYCEGDSVNRSDPTGHWGNPFKGLANILGLRPRGAQPVIRTPTVDSNATTSQRQPPRTDASQSADPSFRAGIADIEPSSKTLPPYDNRKPLLPSYVDDVLIKRNDEIYASNLKTLDELSRGGVYSRAKDRKIAIQLIEQQQKEIRDTKNQILFEPVSPPANRRPTSEEQARNRQLLRGIINRSH